MVGEGIETCLAAMQATGLPAWAALSTSGLRTLQLPAEIDEVIILADGDERGEAAAVAAAGRWKREGRTVSIARPPPGMDFNDVLRGRQAGAQEGAP
jgi:putative DNA primase/helicase